MLGGSLLRVVLGSFICVGVAQGADKLAPARVFGDGMVLQRDHALPVWGRAEPNERVSVRFKGRRQETVADADGQWCVRLEPLAASSEPGTMTIAGGASDRAATIADVVVGDVWVLAGQSNMAWRVLESSEKPQAVARADYPWLRYFHQPVYQLADEPADDLYPSCRWDVCTPETVLHYSAVGFFFAEALHEHVDVPIGLVNTSVSGTYGECWLSRDAMEADPVFQPRLDEYAQALKEYPARHEQWQKDLAAYETEAAEAKKQGRAVPPKGFALQFGPLGPQHIHRPYGLYNGRVAPLMPYAIRGVIWYQGEGNAQLHRVVYYDKLLLGLMDCWRRGWGQGDVPFIVVQLPRYDYPHDQYASWPLLREAQAGACTLARNAGLVVTIDTGRRDDIHPPDKQPVGERVARVVRGVAYGGPVEASGPVLERVDIRGDAVMVTFSHVAEGLRADGAVVKGFAVCGADRRFRAADAVIVGDETVRVRCESVRRPVAVRYAWAPFPDCNLYNSEGLPAGPFRTDRFGLAESK